jgi:hypothetical protein
LDETNGFVARDYFGANNGSYTNALLGQPGNTNVDSHTAVKFGSVSNINSYVGGIPIDFATSGNATFSVECWANGGAQTNDSGIITRGTGGGEQFNLDCGSTSHAFRFFVRDASTAVHVASGNVVPDNTWHHLVGVCDQANGKVILYVDGISNASSTITPGTGLRSAPNPATFGSRQSNSGAYDLQFVGSLEEVAIYPNALSALRVLAHYQAAHPPVVTTLPATSITSTNATLNGTVNPNGAATTAYFRYGLTSGYGSYSATNALVATNTTLSVSNLIGNLTPGTTYHFQLVASNSGGASVGNDLTFTTAGPSINLYGQAVLADNPIGYWRLDETNGSVAHDYFGANSGFYTNALLGQPGNTNVGSHTAVKFGSVSNVNSYVGGVPIGFATSGSATFSVECWANSGPQTNDSGIITRGAGSGEQFNLDCGSTGHGFRFFVRDASTGVHLANGTVTPNNTWHHLVGVCDQPNSKVILYVDGISNASGTITPGTGLLSSTNATAFGSRQSSAGAYDLQFVGSLEEVAIYTNALSAARVLAHYQAATYRPPALIISSVTSSGTNLISSVTNGSPGGGWTWLTTTNLAAPIQWSTNRVGTFDGQGKVTLTNAILSAEPRRFFIMRTP